MPASSSRSSIQSARERGVLAGHRRDHQLVGGLHHGLPVGALHVVAGVDADHVVGTAQQLQHPAHGLRVEPAREPRILLAGQHVVRAVGGVPEEVVEPFGQGEPRVRLDLGQLGHQVADRAGVAGAAGAQAERAAQLVVVPGHARRGRGRCRRSPPPSTVAVVLCTPPLGLANASTRGSAEVTAQRGDDLLVAVRGRRRCATRSRQRRRAGGADRGGGRAGAPSRLRRRLAGWRARSLDPTHGPGWCAIARSTRRQPGSTRCRSPRSPSRATSRWRPLPAPKVPSGKGYGLPGGLPPPHRQLPTARRSRLVIRRRLHPFDLLGQRGDEHGLIQVRDLRRGVDHPYPGPAREPGRGRRAWPVPPARTRTRSRVR